MVVRRRPTTRPDIRARPVADDLLLETYRYPPGPAGRTAAHVHDQFQVCLSLDFPGEYSYRGEHHQVSVGSLTLIHPGELHSARDPHDRPGPAHYRMLYLDPALVAGVAGQLADRERVAVPFFPDPVIAERAVAADFLRLHHALDGGGTRLEQDSRLLDVLARLVREHSEARPDPRRTRPERAGVAAVRRRLHEGLADDVRLAELAELARLSPFHLVRVFRAEMGLPPHAYRTGLRVERARVLLARGRTVSDTAQEVGFYDAGHLSRHFVRVVGVPPGRYRAVARGDAPHRARTSTTRRPGSA